MNILLVSGFLGAGKTTFIKELIKRTGTNPVILENEYGDNSIDAQELQNTSSGKNKLEILEFMEGCVCCTMKDSFVNSVLTVFSSLSPEYLIIEPTGVGRLSNIIKNIEPLLHDNITLLKPIVVVTPRSYRQNIAEWEELYKDQIINADTVVFSKGENESPDVLSETESAIRAINPNADIIKDHYSGQDDEWWRSILALPAPDTNAIETDTDSRNISQLTLDNVRLSNLSELITLLEDCLHGELGHIVRAKGTLTVGNENIRFDLADRMYSITDSSLDKSQCVFIGELLDTTKIRSRMGCLLNPKPVSLTRAYVNRLVESPAS
ncbi:GTPase, G3E family [Butyrivibrio fibrisolvens DSM 3071]|jgi:G3E family GTPase|uniref:GTPase, G3E family n=1 Tax=Butyrivibrio fibrisolvens DSM 3071 TaxID=1121131 RepID=A0A1M5YFI8_BUTFI|nr:GTP-binding protein [Butyrivibrio fibrisolvens]SHI10831.1 GTPase, G3E family [Butyrivibrio fibrisolvens DSM 3071]